ncbi:hypothetical protein HYDPIDRAFT_23413 [Hydnomerulius pinastri MD-312]|nr:hypothetical protein HYDPIDRAFT_23413 [Hydnomerulius pinastri MD-312]
MSSVSASTGRTSANSEVRRLLQENPISGWDDAWKGGVTPWDAGDVQPALRDLILSNKLGLPKHGRALVPGCGKGYDATFIASSLGLEALAVDISGTAVVAARDHFSKKPEPLTTGKVSFEEVDFFKFSVPADQKFDLIYDYTFFVAIPPALRSDWGKQMSALLKQGGYLITLVFPLDLPLDGGPPFHVKPEHYDEVLEQSWEKVLDEIPEESIPTHIGRERLVVYRKL